MRVPTWCKFPIIGSFGGEGGSEILLLDKRLRTVRKTKSVMMKKVIVTTGTKNQLEEFSCKELDIVYDENSQGLRFFNLFFLVSMHNHVFISVGSHNGVQIIPRHWM